MSKSFVIGFVFGLCLLGIAATGASRQTQLQAERQDAQRYQAEIMDATPVQLGVVTPKQLIHSRLHNGFGKNLPGESISEWIASYGGQRRVLSRDVYGRIWFSSDKPEIPRDYFTRFVKESDAIIRGKAIKRTSQITEDDSFLFTDYDVVVSDIFKNNATDRIEAGGTITVTCMGGKILVEDVIIKAGGNGVALLPINAQDVLLFLKYVPQTESYKLAKYNGAFELNGLSARPLVGLYNFEPGFFTDEGSFLTTIKDLSNK